MKMARKIQFKKREQMSIKIVSDRMIDLPVEELRSLNIDTISCYVNMDGKSYSDMDDIFPEDIFKFMDETGKFPQTAAKSPALYTEFFKQFVDNGETVIHFAASSGISSIAENAKIAAQDFPGKVFVIDSLLLSNGIALLAKYAIKLIENGETDAERIVQLVTQMIPKIQCSFLIDTLDCLFKGGRCSGLTFYMASILKIKPVIYMNETGHMVVREKFRGNQEKVLEQYIKKTFDKYPNPELDQLYFAYSTYNELVEANIRKIVAKYHNFKNIQFNKIGCNCSIHSGRNAIAMFYVCK